MARNGSGTYSRAVSSYVYNTVIDQVAVNAEMDDIATALTASLAKDGQTVPTANLPMGGYKLTGLGAGSAAGNSLRYEQLFTTGAVQLLGAMDWVKGANIASATTTNLTTATGNGVHITGTTTITAVTLGTGMLRLVVFDDALTLTHHSTNNNLPGGANITTAAGDRAIYWADGTTVYCIGYIKASGKSTINPAVGDITGLGTGVATALAVNIGSAGAPVLFNGAGGTPTSLVLTNATGYPSTILSGAAIATTSGSTQGRTGISASAKQITIPIAGISTNGTAALQIQVGDSGGYAATGYSARCANGAGAETGSTTGFVITSTNFAAASVLSGSATLSLVDSSTNTWAIDGTVMDPGNDVFTFSGSVSLSGALDRVQFITTDTFDAGKFNTLTFT